MCKKPNAQIELTWDAVNTNRTVPVNVQGYSSFGVMFSEYTTGSGYVELLTKSPDAVNDCPVVDANGSAFRTWEGVDIEPYTLYLLQPGATGWGAGARTQTNHIPLPLINVMVNVVDTNPPGRVWLYMME